MSLQPRKCLSINQVQAMVAICKTQVMRNSLIFIVAVPITKRLIFIRSSGVSSLSTLKILISFFAYKNRLNRSAC